MLRYWVQFEVEVTRIARIEVTVGHLRKAAQGAVWWEFRREV